MAGEVLGSDRAGEVLEVMDSMGSHVHKQAAGEQPAPRVATKQQRTAPKHFVVLEVVPAWGGARNDTQMSTHIYTHRAARMLANAGRGLCSSNLWACLAAGAHKRLPIQQPESKQLPDSKHSSLTASTCQTANTAAWQQEPMWQRQVCLASPP